MVGLFILFTSVSPAAATEMPFRSPEVNHTGTMKMKTWKYFAAAGLGVLLLSTNAFSQGTSPCVSCESLAKLALPNTTITIAQLVEAGKFETPEEKRSSVAPPAAAMPPGMAAFQAPKVDTKSLPAFCRVIAKMKPSSDSDIRMEVWLPVSGWNGKLMGVGGGGTAGAIIYTGQPLGLIDALRLGYAATNTDAGHDASVDGGGLSYMLGHPEKMIDYGYRANHEMTVKAKAIVAAYYGTPPKHSIFVGCSLGSAQAINEVKHYPEDYDGVIAAALMNPIGPFNAAQLWPAWLVAKNPEKVIPAEKLSMIHEAVINKCDKLDGVKDGIIDNPPTCDFDPQELLCKGEDGSDCLTAPQVEYMRQIYKGPVNPRTGKSIFIGPALGAEFAGIGSSPHSSSLELYKYMVFQNPNWDWKTLDYDKDVALVDQMVGPLMYVDADLKPFFNSGGKLMIYIGWEDYHNPLQVIDYYKEVLKTSGDKVKDSIRLFNVPGMGHCSGGDGCDTFDKVGNMESWLETGKAPEQMLSSRIVDGKVVRTRPLCAYPMVARYKGTGSTDDAANFVCMEQKAEGEK